MADALDFVDHTESELEEPKAFGFVTPGDYRHHSPVALAALNTAQLEQAGVIPSLTLSDGSTNASDATAPGDGNYQTVGDPKAGSADSQTDGPETPTAPGHAVETRATENDTPGDEKGDKPGEPPKPEAAGDGKQAAQPKPEVTLREIENDVVGTVKERTRVIDGTTVTVRTPEAEKYKYTRQVQIGDETINLKRDPRSGQKWYYSEMKDGAKVEQVKLHVAGLNSEDMASLQKELLPLLEKLRKEGSVSQYKTFDPNFFDPTFEDIGSGQRANGEGQNSKGFTIYLPVAKVAEVAATIDKLLVEKKLSLPADYKTGTVGDNSRAKTESKRVSVERDMFETVAEYPGGHRGARVDEKLQKELTKAYGLLGMNGNDLSWDALRQIEKDAGLAPEQLTYDRSGKMIFITPASAVLGNGEMYLDESKADKTPGKLTGRPAIYALYGMMDADPAQARIDEVAAEKSAAKPEAGKAPAAAKPAFSSTILEGLDQARDLAFDGPEVKTPEQVKQLLKNTLDQIDRTGDWSESKRDEFRDFQKAYADGVPEVVKAVHETIGLPVPGEQKVADGPIADSSVTDLKRDAVAVEQRTAAAAAVLREGPVKAALVKQGVKEEKASELAKDLVSEDEAKREKAAKEIASHYQTRGGMRAFMSEFKGRAGAAAIVAGTIIPQVIDKK
ncbi:MAG: hypothetical protein K2W95_20970 [Candidatus Obscuribacterales bacterium]|nr:hypothetical protein [Candidatus Obscuribacterales bacterium]